MIESIVNNDKLTITLSGNIGDKIKKSEIIALSLMLDSNEFNEFIINIDRVEKFDISFVVFINHQIEQIKNKNKQIQIIANTENAKQFLDFLENMQTYKVDCKIKENYIKQAYQRLGRA